MAPERSKLPRPERLKSFLIEEALKAGFDVARVVAPDAIAGHAPAGLANYLDQGHHGTMEWMAETQERRSDPRTLWPEVKSILMVTMNYGPDHNPLDSLDKKDRGSISVYAGNRDYHDVMKGRLKTVAGRFAARSGKPVKVFVDTAPVMEKPLAEQAGLGWQGKHSNLVSRDFGSWLFLGSIFTEEILVPDAREEDHCGSCRACLDICPTDAFPEPYQLDARRCISYLTIEHKEPIPHQFREAMGNRIYGCDDCLAVCPWNKFASQASETKLQMRDDMQTPPLDKLVRLDDANFRSVFSGSPVKRIGRDRFIRNVLIACGNSGDPELTNLCKEKLSEDSPLVRGAAVWALSRLLEPSEFRALRNVHEAERDASVQAEWSLASSETTDKSME